MHALRGYDTGPQDESCALFAKCFFPPQETSFASNQPVTRSLSSVTASKKSSSSSSSAATTKVKPPAHSSGAASSSFAGGMDNQVGLAESKQF